MTTLAMIFGAVPLAFSQGEGAEQRAPMGQTVIGGIITSSILTLVVVPVIYTYLDDFCRVAAAPLAGQGTAAPRQFARGRRHDSRRTTAQRGMSRTIAPEVRACWSLTRLSGRGTARPGRKNPHSGWHW
ncbi:efflux RND transporter permease subunit [Cupriavidus basilensis]